MTQLETDVMVSSEILSVSQQTELLNMVRKQMLPKVSLVLDLDETLVHASFERPEIYDFEITVKYNNTDTVVYVQKRPGVDQFIRAVAWEFDVFIFTASMAEYAVPVVQRILPCFPAERILTRPYCRLIDGLLVKDLSIFQRDLSRMILVDNSEQSFYLQPANGILVTSFVGDYRDDVLLGKLLPFLRDVATEPDVRRVLCPNQ